MHDKRSRVGGMQRSCRELGDPPAAGWDDTTSPTSLKRAIGCTPPVTTRLVRRMRSSSWAGVVRSRRCLLLEAWAGYRDGNARAVVRCARPRPRPRCMGCRICCSLTIHTGHPHIHTLPQALPQTAPIHYHRPGTHLTGLRKHDKMPVCTWQTQIFPP